MVIVERVASRVGSATIQAAMERAKAQREATQPKNTEALTTDQQRAVDEIEALPALLAGGWVPPLPREQLQRALADFPAAVAALLLPPQPVLERCFSLAPLTAAERTALQRLWDGAAPVPAA
jgi:hypothetical protein